MKKRNFRTIRKVAMSCTLAAVMTLYLPIMALARDYDIDVGSVTIHAEKDGENTVQTVTHGENNPVQDSSPTVYSTSGNETRNTVTITADNNATANVTLSGVNINTRQDPDDDETSGPAAVSVNGAGNVNIELEGNNYLTGGSHHAGLEDHLSGTLTINDANNNGLLSANGGWEAAGIGGGENENGSYITINGGTITATGGTLGAGIGGGSDGDGNNIIINGGTVTAIGGDNAAGIGGGDCGGDGRNITITGGVVIAVCGHDTGAGIGGGMDGNGSAITISGSAQVSAAGGEYYNENAQAGAAIGDGGSEVMGAEAVIDTTNLYTNGSVKKYAPGSTAEAIAAGTAVQVGDTVVGTVDPPAEPDPVDPDPQLQPRSSVAAFIVADDYYAPATSTAVDADAAFFAAVNMQVEELLKKINALIAEGKLDEANALIAKGLTINAGTHQGFNAQTLAKLGRASRMGIAVTVNFTYGGAGYSVTIPGNSVIDPTVLIDEDGYCGFLNLLNYYG